MIWCVCVCVCEHSSFNGILVDSILGISVFHLYLQKSRFTFRTEMMCWVVAVVGGGGDDAAATICVELLHRFTSSIDIMSI